ncbi:MAG: translation elongation factor 4 [bacterium]
MTDPFFIRNFCIIAHVDHGKSTLADRMLEMTGTISERESSEQMLDQMDLEQEKGITIKAQAVSMDYEDPEMGNFELNLIDTPGHVDFSYEVSRSLAACEGALLLVDASQGVQAQTILNLYHAREQDLEVVPVINKIDLDSAQVDRTKLQLIERGFEEEDILLTSAKEGTGVQEVFDAIVNRIPPPEAPRDKPLKALVFDSHYDTYEGAVVYLRMMDGILEEGDDIQMMRSGRTYDVKELGVFSPKMEAVDRLEAGDVGYCLAGIKSVSHIKIGDTITNDNDPIPDDEMLPGYEEVQPMVYCGLFPVNGEDFEDMRDALQKLVLNDPVLTFEPTSSAALGFGFTCGFLGLLHMEVVQERLEREFELDLIVTAPNVLYRVKLDSGDVVEVNHAGEMPEPNTREEIREPVVTLNCFTPDDHVGDVMELCQNRRGDFENMEYIDEEMVHLTYTIPLGEIVLNFFDQLKSVTHGYGSMDYEFLEYRAADLVKLQVRLNKEPVEPLSFIVHRDKAYDMGRKLCKRLKDQIDRQQFEVPIQAAIGGRVIARETKPAHRKDVTDKCYGGDVTRKRKLLEQQKEGKKRMKRMGEVDVPQEAFLSILTLDEA